MPKGLIDPRQSGLFRREWWPLAGSSILAALGLLCLIWSLQLELSVDGRWLGAVFGACTTAWVAGFTAKLYGVRFYDWGLRHLTLTGWKDVRWSEVEQVRRAYKTGWWSVEFLEVATSTRKVTISLAQFSQSDDLVVWIHDRLVENNPRFPAQEALPDPPK